MLCILILLHDKIKYRFVSDILHVAYCMFEHNDINVKKLLFSFYKQIKWHNNFSGDSSSQQHYGKNLESCHKLLCLTNTFFFGGGGIIIKIIHEMLQAKIGGKMRNAASACEFAGITRVSALYWNILIWICRALRYLMAKKMLGANRYNTIYLYWLSLWCAINDRAIIVLTKAIEA